MVAPHPTISVAREYLKIVKNKFQEKPEKFNTFLKVLRDFKARRIGPNDVIIIVKDLFEGQQELIMGFNTFLPKGYEIKLKDDKTPPKKSVWFSDAISFVNKVKIRFQDDDHAFKTFLIMMDMYIKGKKSIIEVYNEMNILFRDHNDLCLEFYHFLPRQL